MHKILFFLLVSCSIHASPLVEVKGGYFNFSNSKFRKIYKEGGLDVQIAGSYPLWKYLNAYASVEYAQRSGYSLGGHHKTRIEVYPLSLGLKPLFPLICKLDVYGNIGPRYFFVNQRNSSPYVDSKVHQNGLGGFVGAGFLYNAFKGFTADLFFEYSFRQLKFHPHKPFVQSHTLDVGGYAVGLGLGYSF